MSARKRAVFVTWRDDPWQQITFGIAREFATDINRWAVAEGKSRSEFVRDVMMAYVQDRIAKELSS